MLLSFPIITNGKGFFYINQAHPRQFLYLAYYSVPDTKHATWHIVDSQYLFIEWLVLSTPFLSLS